MRTAWWLVVGGVCLAWAWAGDGFSAETIIGIERSAIERWGKGDPQGFLEAYAPDVTYFAPSEERRVDGLGAMRALLEPVTGKIKIDRFEMVNPKVQRRGDVAVLSYQVVNHVTREGRPVVVRWNSTAVYERVGGSWKIMHSHFSYTGAKVKQ